MKQGRAGTARTSRDTGYPSGQVGRVEPPSGRYETFDGGNLFRIAVPSNWRELQGDNSVTFAPEGGYGDIKGRAFSRTACRSAWKAATRAIFARRPDS